MPASLNLAWRRRSLWFWIAALVASFIAYFAEGVRLTHARGGWLGPVFQLIALVFCFLGAFCWGRVEGWFEGQRVLALVRGLTLLVFVWMFYFAIALAGGVLLHAWH